MMMERDEDNDSDAPEEFTVHEGLKQDEEIRKHERENKTRIAQEQKEQRRRWAQRKTPRKSKGEVVNEVTETESHEEAEDKQGMLPNDIVNLLAAREKQVFLSDSEEDNIKEKPNPRKKKLKNNGSELVILKEIPSAQCMQNSLDFFEEEENAGRKIIFSFEQFQAGITLHFDMWIVKVIPTSQVSNVERNDVEARLTNRYFVNMRLQNI